MAKTVNISEQTVTDSIPINGSPIDISQVSKPNSLGIEFKVTCQQDMDGNAKLYLLGSLDGTNYTSLEEGFPLATISDVQTTTLYEVIPFFNTSFNYIKFQVVNTDTINDITVSVSYMTNSL